MNNLNQEVEKKIAQANAEITNSYTRFLNNIEETKKIADELGRREIEARVETIDSCYQEILNIYRFNIHTFTQKHIRTILAMDSISQNISKK